MILIPHLILLEIPQDPILLELLQDHLQLQVPIQQMALLMGKTQVVQTMARVIMILSQFNLSKVKMETCIMQLLVNQCPELLL